MAAVTGYYIIITRKITSKPSWSHFLLRASIFVHQSVAALRWPIREPRHEQRLHALYRLPDFKCVLSRCVQVGVCLQVGGRRFSSTVKHSLLAVYTNAARVLGCTLLFVKLIGGRVFCIPNEIPDAVISRSACTEISDYTQILFFTLKSLSEYINCRVDYVRQANLQKK